MAITVRKGNWADFDPYKMRPSELAIILDRGELYYCTSAGNVKRVATKEEIIEMLETSQEAYDGLQQLLSELEDETVATGILNDIADLDTRVNAHLAESATRILKQHYSKLLIVGANDAAQLAAFSTAVPNGYELIGYVLGGLYTDSNKSSFRQGLVGTVSLSEPTRCRVNIFSHRSENVEVFVEVIGIYVRV